MSAITRFLPKNHLSFLIGKLVHLKLPLWMNQWLITAFAKAYQIRLDEAELSVNQYPSLGEFFIRKLKPGLRPIGNSWAVHPADSVVTQAAVIRDGKLIQAKNKMYTLMQFTNEPQASLLWNEGVFLTYYLCPTDYHRVHSPVSGVIKKVTLIPGALWPVNSWSTENINELFSVNERILVQIETDRGLVGVMFVGATNVGQIILSFDDSIVGNQLKGYQVIEKQYSIPIKKGDELGAFRMGSTVVMLYPKAIFTEITVQKYLQQQVRVNADLV